MTKARKSTIILAALALATAGCSDTPGTRTITSVNFRVRIENVSNSGTLRLSNVQTQDIVIAIAIPVPPGVWLVHKSAAPIFTEGSPDRGQGLEAIAEDGTPASLAAALRGAAGVTASAAFDTPVGASAAGPIAPGAAYEFAFTAAPGAKLSFATMFVPSNDKFYAPAPGGIPLFGANNQPTTGDVTTQVQLWDAGTEVDQEPGAGPDQVQRQAAANTGAPDANRNVRLANDGFTYPAVNQVVKVTIARI